MPGYGLYPTPLSREWMYPSLARIPRTWAKSRHVRVRPIYPAPKPRVDASGFSPCTSYLSRQLKYTGPAYTLRTRAENERVRARQKFLVERFAPSPSSLGYLSSGVGLEMFQNGWNCAVQTRGRVFKTLVDRLWLLVLWLDSHLWKWSFFSRAVWITELRS